MKRTVMGAVVSVVVALLIWWTLQPSPGASGEAVNSEAVPDSVVTRFDPVIDHPEADGEPEDPDAEPAEAERVPLSPAEEGLFAWADASGLAVVRCAVADFPPEFELKEGDLVGERFLTRMVEPNAGDDWSAPQFYAGKSSYMFRYRGAFAGGATGECSVAAQAEPIKFEISAEQIEQIAASINEDALVELDDMEETMHPIQLALESEGLSPGARTWLASRLRDIEDAALDREKEPLTPEALEEALIEEKVLE